MTATHKTYRYTTTLEGPDGDDAEVAVTYSVSWGSPEVGRGYMADPEKYDPGSPDIVEDVRIVTVDGQPPCPVDEAWFLLSIEACYEDMITEAHESEAR